MNEEIDFERDLGMMDKMSPPNNIERTISPLEEINPDKNSLRMNSL